MPVCCHSLPKMKNRSGIFFVAFGYLPLGKHQAIIGGGKIAGWIDTLVVRTTARENGMMQKKEMWIGARRRQSAPFLLL